MIKTAIIYFIIDKCIDRLERQIELNMMQPEIRKFASMWKMDGETAKRIADRILELSEQIRNYEKTNGIKSRYAEVDNILNDQTYYQVVKFTQV